MNKKVLTLYTIIFFLIVNGTYAQKAGAEIDALNLYVDFTNECVHSMTLMYNSIENYNKSAIAFTEKKIKKPVMEFKKPSQITAAYFLPPEQMLKKCKQKGKVLSKDEQKKLQFHAANMLADIDTIALYCDSIKTYINSRYLPEPNLATTFVYLKKCELLFARFNRNKDLLINKVNNIGRLYYARNMSNDYVLLSEAMKKAIVAANDMLRATIAQNKEGVDAHHDKLFVEISRLIDNKSQYLDGFINTQRSNGLDPPNIYGTFIAEANELYKESQRYLSRKRIPDNLKGREYYFYNNAFLPRYNRYGGGIIYAYNQLVEQADVPILKMPEETNWFMVYPRDVEKPTDKDKEKILAELRKEEEQKQKKEKEEREKGEKEKREREKRIKNQTNVNTIPKDPATLEGFAANNLIFLLDVSSSMDQPEKLPVLKEAFIFLLDLMRPEDYVSIVVYSGDAEVILEPTSASQKNKIEYAIENLVSSGKSNVKKGLKLSYKTASKNFIDGGNNRIILATDGGFEINKALYRKASKYARNDIVLSIIYLSKSENPSFARKFQDISNQGNGNYIYVTSLNARKVLLKEAQSIRK